MDRYDVINPSEGVDYCDACRTLGRWVEADLISEDFDRLCHDCATEMGAAVRTPLR